jgi:hypothetical protein
LPNANDEAAVRAASPITYIKEGFPPTIIFHGLADVTVPTESSEHLLQILRGGSVPSELHHWSPPWRRGRPAGCCDGAAGRSQHRRCSIEASGDRTYHRAWSSASHRGRVGVSIGKLIGSKRLNLAVDAKAPLKDPTTYAVVGKPILRPDVPGKCTGKRQYVQDHIVPNMLHGRVIRPPAIGAKLASIDESSIRGIPEVRVVRIETFLAWLHPTSGLR